MTLKRKLILIALTLLVAGVAVWWYRSSRAPEPIQTETVVRGTVSETISVTGELLPERYADLSFSATGQLEALWVSEGERVRTGDPIARLDRAVLAEQLRSVEATLAIAEANERLARRDWDSLTPEERQAKVLASEKARADVAAARASLANRVLLAPFDGIVTQLPSRPGETVAVGERVARLVGVAGEVDRAPLIIEAQVPESDVAKITVGMRATVTFDAFTNDEVFDATVAAIEPSATVIQDVVSYTATFRLSGPADPRLLDGMTANVDIESGRREGVLVLPFRAIAREGGEYSVRVRAGEAFVERPVTIGLEGDEGDVEIVSGLAEGDVVEITTKSE